MILSNSSNWSDWTKISPFGKKSRLSLSKQRLVNSEVNFHVTPPSIVQKLSVHRGGLPDRDPPWTKTPPDRDRPWTNTIPGQRPSWTQTPPRQRPSWKEHGNIDIYPQKEHGTRQPHRKWHHTEWLTHTCENSTLLQTARAGGNDLKGCTVNRRVTPLVRWLHLCHWVLR